MMGRRLLLAKGRKRRLQRRRLEILDKFQCRYFRTVIADRLNSPVSGARAGLSCTPTCCIKMLPLNNKPANSPSLNNEVIRAEIPSAAQGGVAVLMLHPDNPTKGSQHGDDWVFVVSSDDDMDSEDEEAYLYAALYEPKG